MLASIVKFKLSTTILLFRLVHAGHLMFCLHHNLNGALSVQIILTVWFSNSFNVRRMTTIRFDCIALQIKMKKSSTQSIQSCNDAIYKMRRKKERNKWGRKMEKRRIKTAVTISHKVSRCQVDSMINLSQLV